MPKYYIKRQDIRGQIISSPENAHHIVRVLRMEPGEEAVFCDGEGTDYKTVLLSVSGPGEPEAFTAEIRETIPSAGEPETKITLFQGLPKGDKMDLILEKGTELGISRFVPVLMERSVSRPDAKKLADKVAKWNKQVRSAAEQCGRGTIPVVEAATDLSGLLRKLPSFDLAIVFYEEHKEKSLKELLRKFPEARSVAVVIGPEGGLSPEEVAAMEEAGAVTCGLGSRILRTETAGPAAAAMILYEKEG